MKRYAVKEAFLTIQGEGHNTGRRAVFVRFAGCNVWNGHENGRRAGSERGVCAAWCDTNFVGTDGTNGGSYTATDLARLALELWNDSTNTPMVVFTGGEPSLQLDEELMDALWTKATVCVETNGSKALPSRVTWVTLSPKPPMPVVDQRYDEVKVVYPAVDPLTYERFSERRYVQPLDSGAPDDPRSRNLCVEFVLANPTWRVSLQTHKLLGVP